MNVCGTYGTVCHIRVWSRMVVTRCVSQKASYQQGCVIPAHAGIQPVHNDPMSHWAPAFAGVTGFILDP